MTTNIDIPEELTVRWERSPEGKAWLDAVPAIVRDLEARWSIRTGVPVGGDEVSAAWVAPVERADGTSAVLKIGFPHMEAEHEIDGLRFWDGDPTVRLLDADDAYNAMLLERCVPGTVLRTLPEEEQDVIVADLLRRMWRRPPIGHPFRDLAVMTEHWTRETRESEARWPDADVVREGLEAWDELIADDVAEPVLLATDLHAGNILAAEREPWLVIDPKPFVGDPTYDATQHLLNCLDRLRRDPIGTIERFAGLLGLDADRVRRWVFARAAAETRDEWDTSWMDLARSLRS